MKKRRTRQHIIEDLGFNYVERQFLLEGHTLNKFHIDYGYDFSLTTYNKVGEIENGVIYGQLKSTDHLKISKKHNAVEFTLSKRDLELWLLENFLVMLVVYDAQAEKAYYEFLQPYFAENRLSLSNVKKYIQIFINLENVLDIKGVQYIRQTKNNSHE